VTAAVAVIVSRIGAEFNRHFLHETMIAHAVRRRI